jgi:hypothetical protein
MLETVGIMLPLLLIKVASILIQAAKLIVPTLTVLQKEHLATLWCLEAELANNLSRRSTTRFIEQRALARFPGKGLPTALLNWLEELSCD